MNTTSKGRCMEPERVVEISNAAELTAELAAVPNTSGAEMRVFRLASAEYSFDGTVLINPGGGVAILGEPGTVLTGGPTDGVSPLLHLSIDANLYVAGVTLAGGAGNAINTEVITSLYLDDVVIRDFGNIGVSGAGYGHIRRSRISAAATALRWEGEFSPTIILENTALGPGALVGLELLGVLSANIRYVTIAGNGTSLECGDTPGLSGQLRNSILTGTTDLAISGAACTALTFSGNAVDQAGLGSLIGHFDNTWFRDAPSSDFRLTAGGALAIGESARFTEGDPAVDIDGTARPTDRNGSPGVDQP